MIYIQIQEKYREMLDEETLRQTARSVLDHLNISNDEEMSIVVDDDEVIHALNLEHLGSDKPTDVLSFPSREKDPDSGQLYLGDVIISYETAEKQATAMGHAVIEEIQLLVVHGCLHLLGHNHSDKGGKEKMWVTQERVLKSLGINIQPTE
ncbi:MAG: rRNA maturation RNase YbeY [Chloroflexi bacterium]|jgi:probable rRNA maturation factor|nr:rRNA maturation RNase YbeY [Chloroflexota bacterium]MBT3670919.1 rRNA maturation RNase YbeY [Chloroflexota bacterium]MBT4002748.1 rRNA maturation RNase YbeY [Chloroflexota bacterium]MBT4306367.1 rRNA maturation RNase YbeY [Chloroflexota bacterium]MBT4532752.1 rRNA maturation RNase YbeY [Chloroflexota bacterium]